MSTLITIGDFSRMTHLSVKALRHYHDVGLLEPVEVDRSSGYRLYDAGQVPVAQVIRRFRDLGMPVDEVRSMLSAPDDETRNKVIIAHLDRMEAQLAETTSTVVSLRRLLEGPALSEPVEYRHVAPFTALAITSRLRVDEFEQWWGPAFSELRGLLADSGLTRAGPDGALYPGEFFELEEAEVTAYVPVVEGAGASRSTSDPSDLVEIPGAELAVMVHDGGYGDTDRTYGALGTAVAIRGLGVDGPIREHYLVGPLDGGAPEAEWRTEICWPVLRLPER
jgi:DNA-binding transcriptional MerR regulator